MGIRKLVSELLGRSPLQAPIGREVALDYGVQTYLEACIVAEGLKRGLDEETIRISLLIHRNLDVPFH